MRSHHQEKKCLGPLLFILFSNDIHLLPIYSRIILFADDTTLVMSNQSNQFLKYMLEHDMALLSNWYKANLLSLNVDKTVLIKFWPDEKPFRIQIENNIIHRSECANFLG